MMVRHANDIYLAGGVFSGEKMIECWQQECERALSQGYSALRATAEMDWVLGSASLEALIRYESLVQDVFDRFPAIGLCQTVSRQRDPPSFFLPTAAPSRPAARPFHRLRLHGPVAMDA